MENIELYEFFNIMGKSKEKSLKILFCDSKGLVLESDSLSDCIHILPGLSELELPGEDNFSSVIIFFKDGKCAGGYENGSQVITWNATNEIKALNIFDLLSEYNISI
jgi:hypothetical protein